MYQPCHGGYPYLGTQTSCDISCDISCDQVLFSETVQLDLKNHCLSSRKHSENQLHSYTCYTKEALWRKRWRKVFKRDGLTSLKFLGQRSLRETECLSSIIRHVCRMYLKIFQNEICLTYTHVSEYLRIVYVFTRYRNQFAKVSMLRVEVLLEATQTIAEYFAQFEEDRWPRVTCQIRSFELIEITHIHIFNLFLNLRASFVTHSSQFFTFHYLSCAFEGLYVFCSKLCLQLPGNSRL